MNTVTSPTLEPEDTTGVRRTSSLPVILLLVGFLLGLGAGYVTWGGSPKVDPNAAVQTAPTAAGQQQVARRFEVPIGSAPTFGPENAPITIIEFSDYECVYCRKWQQETWPQIQKTYPNQVRLVYKDFPVDQIHPNASPAALAARCANEQGKYWQYHDKLFGGQAFSTAFFESIVTNLGMDLAKWRECVSSKRYKDAIEADYKYGADLGISGTPTFLINGLPMVGAQPFSAFKQVIDQELAAKTK
jgi:protein-disulfide isomerase